LHHSLNFFERAVGDRDQAQGAEVRHREQRSGTGSRDQAQGAEARHSGALPSCQSMQPFILNYSLSSHVP